MTLIEKELIAQQAELMGLPDTARTVRAYCWTPQTRAALVRLYTFASAFGWGRIPGWRLVLGTLPQLSRGPKFAPAGHAHGPRGDRDARDEI